ncbi:MAG TPA: SDR family NAD(P)-dependent oxidoreductase [Ktedonobacteraceae bacterium]
MKYFVTGATGFVGSHVARRLVEKGHEVVVSVRTPSKARELAELGVTVTQGDVTDKESMRGAMQGVDGVFHIAGWNAKALRELGYSPRPLEVGLTETLQHEMKLLGMK